MNLAIRLDDQIETDEVLELTKQTSDHLLQNRYATGGASEFSFLGHGQNRK